MNGKLMRLFVEQFGKEWECTCKEPFKSGNLEIISESDNSLIAQYTCPKCSREQMLAASVSLEKDMLKEQLQTISLNNLTADDVLDIHEEAKKIKVASVRALYKKPVKKEIVEPQPQTKS
ncbi:MAG TPA: hypothetical protein VLE47_04140 [Candidatus Saccharimonadales bacterium]|nr:hypothetical protein [Candidatus Saccharimonadales bacterium]